MSTINKILFAIVLITLVIYFRDYVWSKIVFKYHMIKMFFFLKKVKKEIPDDLKEEAKRAEQIVKDSIINDNIFDKDN